MDFKLAGSPDYWKEIAPQLTITVPGGPQPAPPAPSSLDKLDTRWREHLVGEGYLQLNRVIASEVVAGLRHGILSLRQHSWPAVFAFLYDEYWTIFQRLAWALHPVLGGDLYMLPDFWAWYVDPEKRETGWGPHRDKNINSLLHDGMPKSLTVWLPLTDADPLNGCMYLIPADQDPDYNNYSQNPSPINLHAVRALCAQAGSVLMWNQRVLHWGGMSCDRATSPRISLAFEFQRRDVPPYNQPLLDLSVLPSFDLRLRLVGKQILQYTHMYKYSEDLIKLAREMVGAKLPSPILNQAAQQTGRNSICSCGSGKKYKHCHGRLN